MTTTPVTRVEEFEHAGRQYVATVWAGESLGSPAGLIGFDTETTLITASFTTPELVLASASDGRHHVVIDRDKVAAFLQQHQDRVLVIQNAEFDYRVLAHHVGRKLINHFADRQQLRDPMWLARCLAMHETSREWTKLANDFRLGTLAAAFTDLDLDKGDDSVRMRYGDILGCDLDDPTAVPAAFIQYAAIDAFAHLWVYVKLQERSERKLQAVTADWVDPKFRDRFGVFCDSIHVQAHLVCESMKRQGLRVDAAEMAEVAEKLRNDAFDLVDQIEAMQPAPPISVKLADCPPDWEDDASYVWVGAASAYEIQRADDLRKRINRDNAYVSRLREELDGKRLVCSCGEKHRQCPVNVIRQEAFELFKVGAAGDYIETRRGAPSLRQNLLRFCLADAAESLQARPPINDDGKMSLRRDDWSPYADAKFVALWLRLGKITKALTFPTEYAGADRVHPSYGVLVRTGRTSASAPNIQQLPSAYRYPIRPPTPGYAWISCDFAQLELLTLAEHCLRAYGYSDLASAIIDRKDVHALTASRALGVSYDEFVNLKDSDDQDQRTLFRNTRKAAKAINFSLGGGAGPARLVISSRKWGLNLSIDEAANLKDAALAAFPEIAEHVQSRGLEVISVNLGCSQGETESVLEVSLFAIDCILRGKWECDPTEVACLRSALIYLTSNPQLQEKIRETPVGPELGRLVCGEPAINYAGFARANCGFSDSRNHVFQSIAALGAKLALYRVWRSHGAISFIHDEVNLEATPDDAEQVAKSACKIMCDAMQLFVRYLPVTVEATIGPNWGTVENSLSITVDAREEFNSGVIGPA